MNLVEVHISDKNKLEKLMQLYLHELSLFFPANYDSNTCEYLYDLSTYFKNNKSYFIQVDEKIIGFILLDINEDYYEISEIFIVNNFKKNHYGEQAVNEIFNMYPGNWVIKAVPNSKNAEMFWDKVVNRYTNNNYEKQKTGKYNRPEYYFNNR